MKTLGGFCFLKDNFRYDYCGQQSIESMLEFCDEVSVCYVESEDETLAMLKGIQSLNPRLHIIERSKMEWDSIHGKEKLAHFQNEAVAELDTDYIFLQQADEITYESSYPHIKKAMQSDQTAFLIKRIQLWGSPYKQLNVPHNRLPCSTEVIRLAKNGHVTYGDGESINAQCLDWFLNDIKMAHMGYVRSRVIHPDKIREMQGNIFECGVDEKLNGMDVFDSTKWFTEDDLIPIDGELPRIIKTWAAGRV